MNEENSFLGNLFALVIVIVIIILAIAFDKFYYDMLRRPPNVLPFEQCQEYEHLPIVDVPAGCVYHFQRQ